MKITRLSLWHLALTSHETYYMAAGKTCATVESAVLRIDTDAGLTGWGEVCPIPHYRAFDRRAGLAGGHVIGLVAGEREMP
ncbi:MAG: hypothetical protein AAFW46_19180, partial [Pseudomonadota bacterium]